MEDFTILCPSCGSRYAFDEDQCPHCGSVHVTGEFERLLAEFEGGGFQVVDTSNLNTLEAQ